MQRELDAMIQMGVFNITQLLKNTETARSNATSDDGEEDIIRTRSQRANLQLFAEEERQDEDMMNHMLKGSLRSNFEKAKDKRPSRGPGMRLDESRQVGEQLVEKGVLTRNMLVQLKRELRDKKPKKRRWHDIVTL